MSHNIQLGRSGEVDALQWYNDRGFSMVAQNFQYYKKGGQGRTGEIDLIVQKGNTLVMVEVKTRSNNRFGSAAGQVTRKQLMSLYQAYQFFLLKNPQFRQCKWRFDVVGVVQGKIRVIENAYSFDGLF